MELNELPKLREDMSKAKQGGLFSVLEHHSCAFLLNATK